MLMVFSSVAALIVAAVISRRGLSGIPTLCRAIKGLLVIFAIIGFLSRSFVIVDGDEIGALKRVYLAGVVVGFEGAAAVPGSSNIIRAMQDLEKKRQSSKRRRLVVRG